MIDVAIAIDGEAVAVNKTTRAAGNYSEAGDWVPGASSSTSIMAAIQPVNGNQLKDMPEGIRTEAGWVMWSRTSVALDDVITHGVITYRVLYVWPRADGGFFRAALGRDIP